MVGITRHTCLVYSLTARGIMGGQRGGTFWEIVEDIYHTTYNPALMMSLRLSESSTNFLERNYALSYVVDRYPPSTTVCITTIKYKRHSWYSLIQVMLDAGFTPIDSVLYGVHCPIVACLLIRKRHKIINKMVLYHAAVYGRFSIIQLSLTLSGTYQGITLHAETITRPLMSRIYAFPRKCRTVFSVYCNCIK